MNSYSIFLLSSALGVRLLRLELPHYQTRVGVGAASAWFESRGGCLPGNTAVVRTVYGVGFYITGQRKWASKGVPIWQAQRWFSSYVWSRGFGRFRWAALIAAFGWHSIRLGGSLAPGRRSGGRVDLFASSGLFFALAICPRWWEFSVDWHCSQACRAAGLIVWLSPGA